MRPVLVFILSSTAFCYCASSLFPRAKRSSNVAGSIQAPAQENAASEQSTFRVGVTDVALNPEVVENGRALKYLKQTDFVVFDDDRPQPVVYFGQESVPLDLVLLLDVSGSVQKYFREIAGIATQSLETLQSTDRVAVMLFSRDIWIEQSFSSDRAEISDAIAKAASETPPGSGTRIYAAVRSAAKYLAAQQNEIVRRRAILAITDNDGMSYDVHQQDALRSLYDSAATFDAIVVSRHPHPPAPRLGAAINPDFAFDDVFPLAEKTGGEAVATMKPKESLGEMLGRIRDRYLLVYHAPGEAAPGSFRQIRVELSSEARKEHPRASVRVRTGYYVNGSAPPDSVRP
jgi:VWFA-related protein